MGSLAIPNVIKAISDDKSLVLFNTIALASGDSDILKTTVKLTRKQYYSRMSGLIKAGLVTRKNGNYFVTSFGRIVYDAQLMIGKTVESYWKLKALDSIKLSTSTSPQLPAEEYDRLVATLIDSDDLKNIVLGYKNNNNETVKKEQVYNSHELMLSAPA